MRLDQFLELFFGLSPWLRWIALVIVIWVIAVGAGLLICKYKEIEMYRQVEKETDAEWLHKRRIDLPGKQ